MRNRFAGSLLVFLSVFTTADAFAQTADLSVTADAVRDADAVDVALTVANAGPDAVFNADVAVQFDTDVVTVLSSDEGCSGSSIGLVCSFSAQNDPLIDAGQELTLHATLQTAEDAEVIVTVTSVDGDPNPGNDSTTFQTGLPGAEGGDMGGSDANGNDEGTDPGDAADSGGSTEAADEGCCATTGSADTSGALVLTALIGMLLRRR